MNVKIKQEMTHVDIKTEGEDDNFKNYAEVPIKVEIQTEENDCGAVDINDIDVKPDLPTLQTNTQVSKSDIKQKMTHFNIKTEVEDDNFEKYAEIPIKVEIPEIMIPVKQENFEVTGFKKDPLSIKNKCDLCNKNFTQKSDLNRHVKNVHKGIKDYIQLGN